MSLFLGFSLLFFCILLSQSLASLVLTLAGSDSVGDLMNSAGGRYWYRALQGIANLASWGLPALLWAMYTGGIRKQLGFSKPIWYGFFGLAGLAVIAALPTVEWLLFNKETFQLPEAFRGFQEWAVAQESDTIRTLIALLSDTSFAGISVNILVIAVIPAIAEELFFRGFLLNTFRRSMNGHAAVWLSALIFSLVHFQFYGLFSRILMGVMLGYFFLWSGNLLASIVAHFFHNLVNIILTVLAIRGVIGSGNPEEFGFGFVLTLASVALTSALLYLYYRTANRRNSILKYE